MQVSVIVALVRKALHTMNASIGSIQKIDTNGHVALGYDAEYYGFSDTIDFSGIDFPLIAPFWTDSYLDDNSVCLVSFKPLDLCGLNDLLTNKGRASRCAQKVIDAWRFGNCCLGRHIRVDREEQACHHKFPTGSHTCYFLA
jgi:hypothetical protein